MHDKILQNEEDAFDDDEENELNDGRDNELKKPLCDHFDFTELIKSLPNLEELHLVYGVKGCGMNFDWNMFEFTKKDCQILSKCVQQCKTLRVLHLHRSKVDDLRIRMLTRDGLLDHPTLVELNLENNQISDRKLNQSFLEFYSLCFIYIYRWMSCGCEIAQWTFAITSIKLM